MNGQNGNQIDTYLHRRDVPKSRRTRVGILIAQRQGDEVVLGVAVQILDGHLEFNFVGGVVLPP